MAKMFPSDDRNGQNAPFQGQKSRNGAFPGTEMAKMCPSREKKDNICFTTNRNGQIMVSTDRNVQNVPFQRQK